MSRKRNIIFMGTPQEGALVLDALAASGTFKPSLVMTRPDRLAGRGQKLTAPPVKIAAERHHIEVWQPENLRTPAAAERMQAIAPDLIIVAAYGKLIPEAILNIPQYGCVNIHPSLLPRHRGPSPVQYTILEGDAEAGVSIMLLDTGMDSGPLLAQKAIPLKGTETTEMLMRKLFMLGSQLLLNVLPGWTKGELKTQEQDDSKATVTKLFSKEDGLIKKEHTAAHISRMVRALAPWPGTFLKTPRATIKLLEVLEIPCSENLPPLSPFVAGKELLLHTAQGCLILKKVQPEGKKPMSGYEFAKGNIKS